MFAWIFEEHRFDEGSQGCVGAAEGGESLGSGLASEILIWSKVGSGAACCLKIFVISFIRTVSWSGAAGGATARMFG